MINTVTDVIISIVRNAFMLPININVITSFSLITVITFSTAITMLNTMIITIVPMVSVFVTIILQNHYYNCDYYYRHYYYHYYQCY